MYTFSEDKLNHTSSKFETNNPTSQTSQSINEMPKCFGVKSLCKRIS